MHILYLASNKGFELDKQRTFLFSEIFKKIPERLAVYKIQITSLALVVVVVVVVVEAKYTN